jgi:integrase
MEYNKNLIKFNLKSLKEEDKKTQIFMIFVFNGKRIRYYIRRRIEPKYWEPKKQRAKTSYPNYRIFNAFLNTIANFLEKEFNKLEINDEKVTIEKLKSSLDERIRKEDTKQNVLDCYDEFLEASKNVRRLNTLKSHKSTKNKLEGFEEFKKVKLTFDTFDHKFDVQFKDYLINEAKLTNNTISKYYRTFKVFMKWATEKGYNKNMDYQNFKAKQTEGEIYFLTWDELMTLYELENINDKLKRVRDVFCFGCFTGLRFSDIANLKQENISNGFIEINTIKTSSKTRIPLNKYSEPIYDRYKSDETVFLFPTISNQKVNDYLKDLGKAALINEPVLIVHHSGTKRIEKTVPKYEILTSHVARKTFITNAMIRGMSTEVIMDITTHSSHKSFARYFKIVDEHKKDQMNKVFG